MLLKKINKIKNKKEGCLQPSKKIKDCSKEQSKWFSSIGGNFNNPKELREFLRDIYG